MTQSSPASQHPWMDAIAPYLFGGLSGMTATSVIQPVDTLKVRIQIKGEAGEKKISPFTVIKEIRKNEGIKGFYRGLDSALFRQATYATARLGIYRSMAEDIQRKNNRNLTGWEKVYCSLTAGFLGSLIGNPSDLVLIRFQSDATLPPAERRNYRNVFHAFKTIIKDEGLLTLWRGSAPTVLRAMSLNLGMLGPYDEVKERINKLSGTKDTKQTRLTASCIAGFLAAFMCLPFDNLKTKMQKMKLRADGTMPYKGVVDCLTKTVKNEGVKGLWVGFPTFYFRVAPHAMITLLSQDFLHDSYQKWKKHH